MVRISRRSEIIRCDVPLLRSRGWNGDQGRGHVDLVLHGASFVAGAEEGGHGGEGEGGERGCARARGDGGGGGDGGARGRVTLRKGKGRGRGRGNEKR